MGESHRPGPRLLVRRSGWRQSDAPSGTPCPSQIRCRLLPRLARSVGFGPVSVPSHTAGTEQLSIDGSRPINVAVAREPTQEREVYQIPDAFFLPNQASAASTSSPIRTRVPAGAFATE